MATMFNRRELLAVQTVRERNEVLRALSRAGVACSLRACSLRACSPPSVLRTGRLPLEEGAASWRIYVRRADYAQAAALLGLAPIP